MPGADFEVEAFVGIVLERHRKRRAVLPFVVTVRTHLQVVIALRPITRGLDYPDSSAA